jgi:transposase
VKLLSEGWSAIDVAAAVGASRQSVSKWRKAAGKAGRRSKALAAKPQLGRPCRLSEDQKKELVRMLRAGPRKVGFDTDLWTTTRVAELVAQKFAVVYHSTHVGRLMHALGFSCQKPERRSKEQDPETVEAWREKAWPRIKKGVSRAS